MCRAASAEFRHEALLYASLDEFLERTLAFIRDAVEAGEPILVAVSPEKIARLRAALGEDDAARVQFADMLELGENPARIIPAWHEFVDTYAVGGQRVRGIGEPVWPGRSSAEVDECHCHESLLNVAFGGRDDFWLICPYDVSALEPAVVAEAHGTHPVVVEDGVERESPRFTVARSPFAAPLPEPEVEPAALEFDLRALRDVRMFVRR
jgi:hypothetical protein